MAAYIFRKLLLTIPNILGIVVLTFLLFKVVAPDPARLYAGKQKSAAQLQSIRHEMQIDLPWYVQLWNILRFKFAPSMRYKESFWSLFARKAPVSLAIQLPVFIIELGLQLALAVYCGARRGRFQDHLITALAVFSMSVPALSVYMGAQEFFGGYLKWFPAAGWDQHFLIAIHFAALPILVSVLGGWGSGTRFYRTIVLEEISSDYVRTAKAKGVGEGEILLTHVMRNIMIPVVTNTVAVLPLLFTGALLLERLFQIPGFGGLLVDAIQQQDQILLMAIVYVTAIIYCLMLVVTDICYAVIDPRVTLQ